MIILFSGCDKAKGFNPRIKEIINKELNDVEIGYLAMHIERVFTEEIL